MTRLAAFAAPVLLLVYGLSRWADGLDGDRGNGLAWDAGHVAFFLAFVSLAALVIGLRRMTGRPPWLMNAAAAAALFGAGCFLWVIAGDLSPAFHDAAPLPEVLLRELQQHFLVPSAGLRLWGLDAAYAELPQAAAVSDEAKSFAAELQQPYCGANTGAEPVRWMAAAEGPSMPLASLALVPLRRSSGDAVFGLLALGSPDATRYSADMATDFLARLGEVAGAALSRLLPRTGEQ